MNFLYHNKKQKWKKWQKYIVLPLLIIGIFIIGRFSSESIVSRDSFLETTRESDLNSKQEEQEEVFLFSFPESKEKQAQSEFVIYDVPFVSQAPFGEWSDPRYQDGCEETASLMAVSWAREAELDNEIAKQEIIALAKFQKEKYGTFVDTNVRDTVERIIKDYFDYEYVSINYEITIEDIKEEIYWGNLVLVPTNGQKLNNPYYTPPGPERHMLVIRGFDPDTNEFITNDPGTRRGEGYRYKEDVLYSSIIDYPTGDHRPIQEEKKAMIIIKKFN